MTNLPTSFLIPLLLLSLLSTAIPSHSSDLPINVWPKPTNLSWPTPKSAILSPSFQILSPFHHPHLQSAADRYSHLLSTESFHPILPPSLPLSPLPLSFLSLSISDPSAALHSSADESYTLSISSSSAVANLSAATVWGAIRGLETFSQLTWSADPKLVATDIWIDDRPLFGHRGVMLDTSRNYYEVRDIERTIDAMAGTKLNVFHWHLTDTHSFPIVLPTVPELGEKGAYGEAMRYSAEDVRRVVEYGLSRGVRVMPEIDMPGHTGSWAAAYPDIVTCANMFWLPNGVDNWADRLASEPGTGQLNPLKPETYQVVHNVIRDMAALFPEPFYHAGGDEIIPGCWKADPSIQTFLANGGTLSQLLEIFINSTHPLIVSLNRTVVYWEDVLLDSIVKVNPSIIPPETTILQTWNNGPNNTKLIVSAGYRAIVSSSDFYYLDCGHGDFVGNDSTYDQVGSDLGKDGGSWCGPFKTWQRVYDYDITYGLSDEEAKLVLGGEVALWSEQADSTVLDARLWPRAAAMAEVLWSGNRDHTGKKRYAEATDRLTDWRHRMVGRGIGAEPIQPLWCRTHPGMCNY